MKRTIIYAIILMLALTSCKGPALPVYDALFLEHTDVAIVVGKKEMIDFSSGLSQASYNPTTFRFRVGLAEQQPDRSTGLTVETVTDFFVLDLSAMPAEQGQKLTGKLQLVTTSLARSYTINDMQVLKKEDGKAWLWDDKLKLGVVVVCP